MASDSENLQRIADYLEQQVHGGSTGLGNSTVNNGKSVNVDQINALIKNAKLAGQQFGFITKTLKANQTASMQVVDSLKELDSELDTLRKGVQDQEAIDKQAVITAKRRELAEAAASATIAQTADKVRESLSKTTSAVTSGISRVITGLSSGSSTFETTAGIFSTGLDVAGETSKAAGSALGAVGSIAATSTNPALRGLGAAASIAGPALGLLGDTASKAAKFGFEVLSREVERTIKSFDATTAAGAMFTDGMSGMRNAAGSAGLTVEQFSGVVQKHSMELAASGLGVTMGAKLMGAVGKQLRDSKVDIQLMKLGFGFEEQAELIATTTANMRRTSGGRATASEIATQTVKYAESLRTIAAITGEDAKRKVEEAKSQNQILAFQQEMALKTPAQRAAIDAAMATMTEQERKNFRDRAVFGQVINAEGAIYEATISGARQKGEAQLALLEQNRLTAETNSDLNAQFGSQISESAKSQLAIGEAAMVVGGQLGDVSKSMLDAINQANIYTAEASKLAAQSIEGQKRTADDLTMGVVSANEAMQGFRIALQDMLTPAIGRFADFTGHMLTDLSKLLATVTQDSGPSWWSTHGKTMMLGAVSGAALGTSFAPGLGTAAGAVIGAIAGYADGGISTGSPAGHMELLHGTELIVPLTSLGTLDTSSKGFAELTNLVSNTPASSSVTTNNTTVNTSQSTSDLLEALGRLLSTARDQLEKQDEMLRAMQETKDYTERLYSVMA